jgi:hypothetical protein
LLEALSAAPDRLTIRQDEAVGLEGTRLHLPAARAEARAVVLALGNLAPSRLPVLAGWQRPCWWTIHGRPR